MTDQQLPPLRGPYPQPGAAPTPNPRERASFGALVAETPKLFIDLAKDELEQARRELLAKGKKLGIGGGLLAAAGFFALTMYAVLVTAAILGLNEVFAPWLSALIVAAGFLVITAILALVGITAIKKATPVTPEQTIVSVKQDLNAVKGLGQYE